jgi:hypothetical protein
MTHQSPLTPVTVLDKTFGTFPEASECPDDSRGPCYKHVYPEGKLSDGDMLNFYTAGPEGFDTTNAKEVLFTFQVWFNDDFDFVKGGKLPGLYGGTSTTGGKSCSGGDQRDDCFSARGMWRTDGAGELYNYFPFEQNYCNTPDSGNGVVTVCESGGYGASVDRGAFTFPKGKWVSLAQRLKLNDPGQANGEQELFVDGVSKIKHTDVQIRGTDDVRIQGVMAQSFFGGSKDEFRPPKDETAYFTGYAYGIISTF